eukprot:m.163442 g.163442  ORF g.163442 m.163442 type:complete len:60 (-) comp15214_c0_seq2:2446-2625(-)
MCSFTLTNNSQVSLVPCSAALSDKRIRLKDSDSLLLCKSLRTLTYKQQWRNAAHTRDSS